MRRQVRELLERKGMLGQPDLELPSQELLLPSEVAQYLRLSPWTLLVWRRKRKGPPWMKLGRNRVRYTRVGLQRWLRSRLHASSQGKQGKEIENG